MGKFGGRFIVIYMILLFTGLAFSALGYRFDVSGFTITGAFFIVLTPYAVRSYVPLEIRKWSIALLLPGAAAGAFLGTVLGEPIKPLIGLIGGIMIGGIGGWVLYSLL